MAGKDGGLTMHPVFVEGVLLRSVNYRDSDLVVTLATPAMGAVGALARGARKSTRRFGAVLDYFNLLRAQIKPSRAGLATLTGVELLRSWSRPRSDVEAYFAASHYLEVVRLGVREGDACPALYHLLIESLDALERGAHAGSLTRVFRIRAVSALGYSLAADRCPACGATLERGAAFVRGAPSCHGCAGTAGTRVSAGGVRTLEAAGRTPLGQLKVSDAVEREVGPVVDAALVAALGSRPKTMEV